MENINFRVDSDKCINCGLCVKDCSTSAIELNENNSPYMSEAGEKRCMGCQHCLAVCPTGAISIFGKNPQNSDAISETDISGELLNLIESRRSVRHLKRENTPKDKAQILKRMIDYVPTGCNNHGLYFSFVEDIEVMDRYREFLTKKLQDTLKYVPDGIMKKFLFYKDRIMAGEDIVFRGAPNMVVVSTPKNAPCKDVDPIIALSYFELMAQSMGIGTVWCGLATICFDTFKEMRDSLNIPETHKISYVMLYGPSNIKYARTIQPLPYQKDTIVNPVFELKESLKDKLIEKVRGFLKK